MKHNRLLPAQVTSLRREILQGKSPADLMYKYDVAISTVNAHKAKLKEEEKKGGPHVPDIRGKRPIGTKGLQDRISMKKPVAKKSVKTDKIKVMINGIPFFVPSSAKSVTIEEDKSLSIEI